MSPTHEQAPDGSLVVPLLRGKSASMARFELAPSAISRAVMHRRIEELWYVLEGKGELWLRSQGSEQVRALRPGISLLIPKLSPFQFRAADACALTILGCTIPAWSGPDEVIAVAGRWQPTETG